MNGEYNRMSSKEINEFAKKDHRTLDNRYNNGLNIILKLGYEYSSYY